MSWILYTDGGTAPTNPGPSAWGAVLQSPAGELRRMNGFLGQGTNQVAELSAALNGLRAVPEGEHVQLFSDSQYVIKGISEWRAGWQRNGWRNSANKTISNLELWRALFAEVDKRRVEVKWVKGHADDPMNNLADELATAAIEARRCTTEDVENVETVVASPVASNEPPSPVQPFESLEARVKRLEAALAHLAENAGALVDRELARLIAQEGHSLEEASEKIFGSPKRFRPS